MPTDVVDWDLALATGSRLAPGGPEMSLQQAQEHVASLRRCADMAVAPVAQCTGLTAPGAAPPAAVVDRRGWIESNVNAFRYVLSPVLDRLRTAAPNQTVTEVGSRVSAVQMGAIMGWLSGKVLGQYEALVPAGQRPRLLLVAPNIVKTADALAVPDDDFKLWVCLHEETHRVQFTAIPWMSNFFAAQSRMLVAALDVPGKELLRHTRQLATAAVAVMRGEDGAQALITAMLTPEQRVVYDRISALMTLLEGHADVVMDEVGPEVVPTVAMIRTRFDERRTQPGTFDSVARRLVGVDAKMRQYSEGAGFVRAVVDTVGMSGFNAVWQSPESLPTLPEIAAPREWIARVHG